MTRRRALRIGVVLVALAASGAFLTSFLLPERIGLGAPARTASADPLRDVPVYVPAGDPGGLVILVSDGGGIVEADRELAAGLLDRGLAVLPVDLEVWRTALNKAPGACLYLGSAIEGLAKDAQRALGSDSYFHPVVAGRGEGGTLAFAAVADAPAATMAGGVALGAPPPLRTRLPVCAGATPIPTGGGFAYDVGAALPEPFVVVEAGGAPAAAAAGKAEVRSVADDGATAAFLDAATEIADADATALPVIDLPPAGEPVALAVFFSGDGGWRDLDKTIGEWLQANGVHVVGVDSLRYFWSEKDAGTMAGDIASMVATADPSAALPVALLGYSFGADTLPFAMAHMDERLVERTRLVALLAPGRQTGFEISVGGWLGLDTGETPVVPAIAALPAGKILCVHGADEGADSACTDPTLAGLASLELGGGHHFDGDYEALAARLRAAVLNGPTAALSPENGS